MSSIKDGTDFSEVMAAIADTSQPGYEAIDTFHLLVRSATSLTAAVEAGILLSDHNQHLHVVASTRERNSEVEEAQLGFEKGPCRVVLRTGKPVDVPDIPASRHNWPTFAAIAAARGFQSAHVAPMPFRGRILGALILFSEQLGPLSDPDAASIETLVRAEPISLHDELHSALDARVTIELAKGVLAQRYDVPIDAAFSLLRDHARRTDMRVSDIAHKIVNSGRNVSGSTIRAL